MVNDSRLERLSPLTGVLMVLLALVGVALLGIYEYLPSADRAREAFTENPTRTYIAGYLGLLSAFFLMWFAGSVFVALREREGGSGRLSTVAFGGGVASGVVWATGFSIILTAGERAGAAGGISAAQAVTLYDLYGSVLGMSAIPLAVFIAATAAISLRTRMFPGWFGWASALVAFGLLTPISYLILAFALVWLLGVSISLYRRGATTA